MERFPYLSILSVFCAFFTVLLYYVFPFDIIEIRFFLFSTKDNSVNGVKKMSAYLTFTERHTIEIMLKDGKDKKEIASVVGKHYTTIYREIKKGTMDFLNWDYSIRREYCCDIGQRIMQEHAKNKGLEKKLVQETELLNRIAYLIKEKKYSPYAVLQDLKKNNNYPVSMCETTLYKFMRALFPVFPIRIYI